MGIDASGLGELAEADTGHLQQNQITLLLLRNRSSSHSLARYEELRLELRLILALNELCEEVPSCV